MEKENKTLKDEIKDLKNKMSELNATMEKMTEMMKSMIEMNPNIGESMKNKLSEVEDEAQKNKTNLLVTEIDTCNTKEGYEVWVQPKQHENA